MTESQVEETSALDEVSDGDDFAGEEVQGELDLDFDSFEDEETEEENSE